jgi:hypothetical protein
MHKWLARLRREAKLEMKRRSCAGTGLCPASDLWRRRVRPRSMTGRKEVKDRMCRDYVRSVLTYGEVARREEAESIGRVKSRKSRFWTSPCKNGWDRTLHCSASRSSLTVCPVMARWGMGACKRTWGCCVRSCSAASSFHLTARELWLSHWRSTGVVESRGHVAASARPNARQGASGHPDWRVWSVRRGAPSEHNGSISLGGLYKRGTGLGSLSWPFLLRIHPSELATPLSFI